MVRHRKAGTATRQIRRASEQGPNSSDPPKPAPDQIFEPHPPGQLQHPLPVIPTRRPTLGRGRRSQTTAVQQGGHYLRAVMPQGRARDVALDATLRAAALRLANRTEAESAQPPDGHYPNRSESFLIKPSDLRIKLRRARTGNLILFVVDASGSMGARKRMIAVKGAVLGLLLDAYQKRDRVGLISFRGAGADLLVSPTNSVELAERQLRRLPTGGRTPLAAGLQLADRVLSTYLRKDSALTPLLVLISDGRANGRDPLYLRQTARTLAQKRLATLILDSEQGFVRLGLARELAGWLGATYLPLDHLGTARIEQVIRHQLASADHPTGREATA